MDRLTVPFPLKRLLKTSTSELAMIIMPVPLGTSPTIFPSGAKLSVSLSIDWFSKTLMW